MSEVDRYSSHIPILRAVCNDLEPRRILEFGAGLYSTPFFLSLPYLEQLVSVEEDPEWIEKALENDDQRLKVEPSFEGSPMDHDLIFIDNARSIPERARTIDQVLSRSHPAVVIHDAEEPQYAEAIKAHSYLPATVFVPSADR